MRKFLLVFALIVALTLVIAVPAFAVGGGGPDKGGPPDKPGNPNDPGPQTIFFVDYLHPAPDVLGEPFTDQVGLFEIIRIGPFRAKLDPPAGGVPYKVNTTGSGLGVMAAKDAVEDGFEEWDSATSEVLFASPGTTTKDFGNSFCVGEVDGENTVFWDDLSLTFFHDALAVACVRLVLDGGILEVVEFDIVFNTKDITWEVCPLSGCTGSDTFDVQDIATHEAGHSLFMGDLSQFQASELTMFGFITEVGELKKRDLGHGDELGLRHLYGP